MYDLLKEFIKPELLILVPVLYLIGVALKKSAVTDKHIPWILGSVGIIFSFIWIAASTQIGDWKGILLAVFTGFVQGVLTAGASVYVNQLIKQKHKTDKT